MYQRRNMTEKNWQFSVNSSEAYLATCIAGLGLGQMPRQGIHIMWKYALGEVFSVAVSSHQSKGLIQADLTGAQWLSGGAYGQEASVLSSSPSRRRDCISCCKRYAAS